MKKIIAPLLLAGFLFSGSIYAQEEKEHREFPRENQAATDTGEGKYGTASFYAKKFDGRQTANGETYNGAKYTAACNILPLGTWIKVTNLHNKKTVVVKINDRMHLKNKRLVDLSGIAATDLAFHGYGLTHVKIEIVDPVH